MEEVLRTYIKCPHKIAKYNFREAYFGHLIAQLAVFIGIQFMDYISNFIIDKSTNKIYTGEGFNFETGSRIS
jgi:hypothetical protein